MSGQFREAALRYASAGWPVIPLRPREKTPLTRHGLKDATTNTELIEALWALQPEANVGLLTGVEFDVLDIDGPLGLESMRQFHWKHPGPVSSTGKGFHLLFAPTGARNGAAMLPGLDFRGEAGYIVAPPSIHPSGHEYAWVANNPPELVAPEAPQWLLDLVVKPETLMPSMRAALFPNTRTAKVVERLSIEDELHALGAPTLVRRANRRITSCPLGFHRDSTPSFNVYEDDHFYCYGCQNWGDALNLRQFRQTGRLR